MNQMLTYIWIGLSLLIAVIPLGFALWRASQKVVKLWDKKQQTLKENREIKEMKQDLEEQQGDLLTNNEYWSFVSGEKDTVQEEESLPKQEIQQDRTLEEPKESPEKMKKRLEGILMEATVLKNAGKFEEYEKKLIEGLAIDDEAIELLKPLSDLYFALGNYKKAQPLLKKVSELDPSDHRVIWQIAEIYFVAGYYQTAELLLEKAINLKNDNPKYYLTMVEIYYNTQRMPEALAYMEKIIKLRPTNPKYLLATAELYEEMGDKDNAKKYYFNVLEYEPHNEKAKSKIKEFSHDWA